MADPEWGVPPPPRPAPAMRRTTGDAGVQSTNDDAQISKMSCVQRGYFSDPFVHRFVRRPQRRNPLINRGYWARYAVVRKAMSAFMHATAEGGSSSGGKQQQQQHVGKVAGPSCQVVVLGAGFDTAWFQLAAHGKTAADAVPQEQQQQQQAGLSVQFPPPLGGALLGGRGRGAATPHVPLELSSLAANAAAHLHECRYIEVDFPETAAKKARTILSSQEMWQLLPQGATAAAASDAAGNNNNSTGGGSGNGGDETGGVRVWRRGGGGGAVGSGDASHDASPPPQVAQHAREILDTPASTSCGSGGGDISTGSGGSYSLVGADLRRLDDLEAAVRRGGFDPSLPTLYVSECCLVYLEPPDAAALLSWAARTSAAAGAASAVVVYEMVRPDDAFGQTMVANLEDRGCPLLGLPAVPLPSDQARRLADSGWGSTAAADMCKLYYSSWLPQAARAAAERLELLDELEEWRLMQSHYCLAIGAQDPSGRLQQALGFEAIAALQD